MLNLFYFMGVKEGKRQERSGEKLKSYVNRCLRFILGIWWPNVISNEGLWARTERKEIWKEIRYRKWKWIDHILSQENESIAKKSLEWNTQGGRRGRPRNFLISLLIINFWR
jgi:hypothetical protein